MKYFAYGSNMYTKRLQERVPSCKFFAVANLPGYTLNFHKKSNDGSGKCNAYFTNCNDDLIIGVIFEIPDTEKARLDRAEGLGHGYHEVEVPVTIGDALVVASMYVADPNYIDESLFPYTWYKEFVLTGAYEHNLPEDYIQQIKNVNAVVDTDKQRDSKNRKLLPHIL